ncbi:MAG: c-type cytochrome, partial [Burkholderiales bacterium]
MSRQLGGFAVAATAALILASAVWMRSGDDQHLSSIATAQDPANGATEVKRGAYLTRAGNCMACHSARGGEPYAGGRPIPTPFGTIYSTNLTPDVATGLGGWSRDDFWRALHHGESKDGRLLYPAFPYPSLTRVSRADSDAMFAWLQAQPAVQRAPTPNEVRWPYSTQAALAVWRALYFKPATFAADPTRSTEWNRGAYLVQGLGHCAACHAPRDALGGTQDRMTLSGGKLPAQPWYAPSLIAADEAGLTKDTTAAFIQLMQTGVAANGVAIGPMAEVVQHSTQHLSSEDTAAMADYLLSLAVPASAQPAAPANAPAPTAPTAAKADLGAKRYEEHCAQCHGAQGEGVSRAYPALAGSRAVQLAQVTNLVQVMLYGGFAPAT